MDDWIYGVLGTVTLLIAFGFGWTASATTIGKECKSIGAFYVGENVYTCKPKQAGEGEK